MTAARHLSPLVLLCAVASCELGSTELPPASPVLVVHAVLNADRREQEILVEESLTGARPDNQNGSGTPVVDAIITLTDPNGLVMTAREIRPHGAPEGLYLIDLDEYSFWTGSQVEIIRGGRYQLSVSARGMMVTGTTLVPNVPISDQTLVTTFNRDRDSVRFDLPPVATARAYWFHLQAPVEEFSLFTLDREITLTGETRNFFADELVKLFFPGFVQTAIVAAIDTNLYDYYRSGSDPFSGAGLINRLAGGVGVFGAMAQIERRTIQVTQDPTGDPIEGEYTLRSFNAPAFLPAPRSLRLYLEAKGTAQTGDRITGNYVASLSPESTVNLVGGIVGRRTGSNIRLEVLASQSNTETTMMVFNGAIRGDTLRGGYGGNTSAVFVKAGK